MFIIYGEENSGKTHTAWLVLIKLLASNGITDVKMDPTMEIVSEQDVKNDIRQSNGDHKKAKLRDFRVLLTYIDKKVAIISAGDHLKEENGSVTSFIDSLEWANRYQADYIVCCSRSRNRKGSVCQYIMGNYKQAVCEWYYKDKTNKLEDQVNDAKKVAGEVFRDINNLTQDIKN